MKARDTASARLLSVALAGFVGLGALSACSSSDAGELVIYSGRTEELIKPLLDDFAEQSGISIAVRYAETADLALQIDEEGDRSPADVFLSQSPGAVGFLDAKERLTTLPDDILDQVDARFRAKDGHWVGISGRVRVVVYNTELVDPGDLPQSVFDVTDPQYSGRFGVAPTNASFVDFVTAMREDIGDDRTLEWLEGIENNGAVTYANNVAIVEAVGRGEIDFGLVNHYYNEEVKAEDPDAPSANHLFESEDLGGLILVTATAILDTADKKSEAEKFIDFLLSEKAQEYYANETLEYPLAAGVKPAITDLPPLDEIVAPEIDLSSLGGGLERTKELIEQSGLEQG
jgi:iron(III) transport system substrate-binding protein